MSDQNRKYYPRGNENLKDEVVFKISNNSDHQNKFLVEKIETKNKKKFIKQYKLDRNEVNHLVFELKKKNISIISSEYIKNQNIQNYIISDHPEYSNNSVTHLDSYKKTITAKFNDEIILNDNNFIMKHLDGYDIQNIGYSQITPFENT
jgi:DNA mismatch repair ATPase MutS